jgi:simple sugar transport system ATP-binding protein
MTDRPPVVEIVEMSKRFGALQALDRVSLTLASGAYHALLGENGAGKSTLVKCLMGYHQADQGSISIGGSPARIASTRDAHSYGLGMVYQHFTLIPSMTVAENLAVVRDDLPLIVNWRKERARIEAFLEAAPFRLNADRVAGDLAAGEKQKLEILKQLYLDRRILILDEPTSVLTPDEASEVLTVLKELCGAGRLSVLLITHKLREVFAFASTVSALRRGKLVGEGKTDSLDAAALARMMVGDQHGTLPRSRTPQDASEVSSERFRFEGMTAIDDRGRLAVRDVSLSVRSGEIVGIAGVSGNGQKELVQVLAGQRPKEAGRILVDGKTFRPGHRQRAARRLGVMPEEPRRSACAGAMSVADNLALDRFDRPPLSSRIGWLIRTQFKAHAEALIAQFSIRCSGPNALVQELSGGNVQRVVLARTLSEQPDVIVMANPCVGLDIAAVREIHDRIISAAEGGAAILIVSEDLDELLSLSTRILVMFEGQIVHESDVRDESRQAIGQAMAGLDQLAMSRTAPLSESIPAAR